MNETSQNQIVIVKSEKSVGLAVALAFFFGPIGLLYSTPGGAVVMFIINVIVAIFTFGLGLLLTWPICAIWAWKAAAAHNKQLQVLARV